MHIGSDSDRMGGFVGLIEVGRVVTGPLAENCYVLSDKARNAVVVDPGEDFDRIARYVEGKRLQPRAVLATHAHHDHVGALAEFVESYGVPFGIHSRDSEILKRVNFYRLVFHELGPVEVPPIDIDFAVTTALSFGDVKMSVVHTPGHSPGSVCFDLGGRLLTGDTVMATHVGRGDLPGSDALELEASVRHLIDSYPPDTPIYPGHGEPGTLGDAAA